MAAGTTKTVKVKLKRASFRKLQRKGSRRANAVLTGTDSAGSPFAAKQAVRLLKARKRNEGGRAAAGVAGESGKFYCLLS